MSTGSKITHQAREYTQDGCCDKAEYVPFGIGTDTLNVPHENIRPSSRFTSPWLAYSYSCETVQCVPNEHTANIGMWTPSSGRGDSWLIMSYTQNPQRHRLVPLTMGVSGRTQTRFHGARMLNIHMSEIP